MLHLLLGSEPIFKAPVALESASLGSIVGRFLDHAVPIGLLRRVERSGFRLRGFLTGRCHSLDSSSGERKTIDHKSITWLISHTRAFSHSSCGRRFRGALLTAFQTAQQPWHSPWRRCSQLQLDLCKSFAPRPPWRHSWRAQLFDSHPPAQPQDYMHPWPQHY
jgi:hypothetical protein